MQAIEQLLTDGHSYTELSVEQIAARAGISRTAFYFYFNDKRQVLMRLVEGVSQLFYDQADRWWSGSRPDDPGELREVLSNVLKMYGEHAAVLTAIVDAASYDDEITAFWQGLMERFIDATRDYIETEQKAGRGGNLEPASAAFVVVWMTERAWYQHLTRPTVSDEGLIDALTEAVWSTVHGAPVEDRASK